MERRFERYRDGIVSKGLKGVVSVVEPTMTEQGWRFGDYPGSDQDTVNGATYLHELYTRADLRYSGRATIPILWDKQRRTIVIMNRSKSYEC